jgi:hypothetical protein
MMLRRVLLAALATTALALVSTEADTAAFDVKTFRPWANYAIPNGEWRLLDFDGDGDKDVVHIVAGNDIVHTWRSNANGTFQVGTFRPWAGYAMPNGLWLTADINGDGREDLVHAVQGRDYVHTWRSRGDGTFTVGTFRPWAGYAIPNGEWRVVDLDGDGRSDLVHVVAGNDIVHTWRSNGDGTFRVGTFRPWAGYAMPNGLWLTGDFNGDGRGDLVHAVQGADFVHTWLSRGDGTFTVGNFRPWAGYAIPNGEWRVLDFDGDGRADIVHIVPGNDIVHTWRSTGTGAFSVGTFRPWAGYAMPNGLWLTGDFDGDGRGDLIHAVQSRDYAHTWLSNGNGTFRIGTFSPWAGYAVPNGLWLAGDLNADRKTDIFHAVLNRDYAHPWLSTLPRPNEFALEGLEITQAVQSMAHTVPLVAAKPTVVRAYPMFNGSAARQVRGTLWVRNTAGAPWQLLSSQNVATVVPAENGNLRTKRENTDRGLNFAVPPGVLGAGTLVAWFQGMTDAGTGAAVPCSDCSVTNRSQALGDANPMRVRVLGMRYTRGTPAQTFQPRAQDFALIRSWLTRAYPTGDLRMTQATVNATAAAPFGCGDVNAQLTAIRNADIAAGTDRRTHYYGIVFEDGSANSFFMRGCAAGIPGSPSPGTTASGPTGAGTWGWDNDGSYGDWYTGHELGHTYGRFHIGSGCGESSDDANYPYANGQISGADGAFVGFDTGDAANGIAMRALPGGQWTDFMSYCANQWVSDYTYTRVRDRIAAENALPAGPMPAMAMSAAVEPAAGPSAVRGGPPAIQEGNSPPPVGVGQNEHGIGFMVPPAATQPAQVEAAGLPPEAVPEPAQSMPPDVVYGEEPPADVAMGMAALAQELPTAAGPLPPDLAAEQPAARGDLRAQEVETTAVAPEREFREGDFLAVAASVNVTRQTAEIVDARRLERALVPVGDPGPTLQLRALDEAGAELAIWNVPFLPNTEREPGEDLMGVLDAVVPFVEGVASVEVLVDGTVADTYSAAPEGAVGEAELTVEQAMGAAAAGMGAQAVTLDWSAAGAAPTGASYDVQVSTDGGASWQTVAMGLSEPRATIDLEGIDPDGQIELRVLAKDGFSQRVLDTVEVTSFN